MIIQQSGGWKSVQGGFTLIELMVVMAIVAILVTIAVPAYNQSVIKSRRTDGKSALLNVAARQEKYFFSNNQYACTTGALGVSGTSSEGFYTITIPAGTCSATAYVAQAAPTPTGGQTEDTACATLTLSNLGVKGITGTGTASDCW